MGTRHRFPDNPIVSLVGAPPRHDLAESVVPSLRLGDLLADDELTGIDLGYATAAGDPALRAAIAAANGPGTTAEDVVVTVGGAHALFLLAFTLCDPGDQVVTMSPLFPVARNALEAVGADVGVVPLTFADGYRLDPDRLREHLSPGTKLVSIASPQNPSGVTIPIGTVEKVLAIMGEVAPDAYLLMDETYRQAAFDATAVAPSAAALSPKVIVVSSLSKCHGAAGLRIGWAITRDSDLLAQLVTAKFNTVLTCSPVTETLALRLLERNDEVLAAHREHLSAARATTADWVQANADVVDWVRPDAGAICCVRLSPSAVPDAGLDRFYDSLSTHDVRVADGTWFGDEHRVFRLGFGHAQADALPASLDALAAAIRT